MLVMVRAEMPEPESLVVALISSSQPEIPTLSVVDAAPAVIPYALPLAGGEISLSKLRTSSVAARP